MCRKELIGVSSKLGCVQHQKLCHKLAEVL